MNHLNEKVLYKTCDRIDDVKGSLMGISGLIRQTSRDSCFVEGELYGLGQLLKRISEELDVIEDILRSGEDSTADQRNGFS